MRTLILITLIACFASSAVAQTPFERIGEGTRLWSDVSAVWNDGTTEKNALDPADNALLGTTISGMRLRLNNDEVNDLTVTGSGWELEGALKVHGDTLINGGSLTLWLPQGGENEFLYTAGTTTLHDGGTLRIENMFPFEEGEERDVERFNSDLRVTGTGGNLAITAPGRTAGLYGDIFVDAGATFNINATGAGAIGFRGIFTDTMESETNITGIIRLKEDITIKGNFNASRIFFEASESGAANAFVEGTVNTTYFRMLEGDAVITGRVFMQKGEVRSVLTDLPVSGIIQGNMTLDGGLMTLGTFVEGDVWSNEWTTLQVHHDFISRGGTIALAIDREGDWSKFLIVGSASIDTGHANAAPTTLHIYPGNCRVNLDTMGRKLVAGTGDNVVVEAWNAYAAGSNPNTFVMNGYASSKYDIWLNPGTIYVVDNDELMYWTLGAEMQTGGLQNLSSLFLVNIVGFDLPRAHNETGPWGRIKGGHLYDDQSALDNVSYQVMQLGWDKSFRAALGGKWSTGLFLEGNWMYSKGDYRLNIDRTATLVGLAKTSNTGMGTGLRVSRTLPNKWYFDVTGRINVYESKGSAWETEFTGEYYGFHESAWTDKMFSLGLEVGKTFTSRDKRLGFNPYNRLIYNSSPGNEFRLAYLNENTSHTLVKNHGVDAWTNQLGATLALNSLDRRGNVLGNVFVKGEYYQGLAGNFDTTLYNYHLNGQVDRENGVDVTAGRSKNDLSYYNLGFGAVLGSTDRLSISTQVDFLFGDVSGWSVTLGGRLRY